MKLFEWLPESETDHRGTRKGHYLWLNCRHFHFGRIEVMVGGVVFMTMHPERTFRGLGLKHCSGGDYEFDLWLIHVFFNPKPYRKSHTLIADDGGEEEYFEEEHLIVANEFGEVED